MFANMSLKFKLIGSFCIVAVVLCVVGVVGYSGIVDATRGLNSVGNVEMPAVIAAAKMQQGQLGVRVACNAIMNPQYPEAAKKGYPAQVEGFWKDIDDGIKDYQPLERNAEEEAMWKEFLTLIETYRSFYNRFQPVALAYVEEKNPAVAQTHLNKMCEIAFGGFAQAGGASMKKLATLTEANTKMAMDEMAAANARAARSKAMSLIFSIGGLLAALGFGIFLSLNISRRMSGIAMSVADGAGNISAASTQVASSAQSVASGSQQQAASIEETSSSLEELAAMTKQNADNTKTVAQLMNETKNLVSKAANGTETMDAAMREIKSASDQTSKIIKTIDEIAFQTNLLALNAAVEAARAGEAGKGFAVVAEEVRNLAMRAAEAAKNTGALIEENVNRVAGGVQIVEGLKNALGEVTDASGKVASLVTEIAAASDEQSKGIEQINVAVTQMNQVTQANAANAEESASASEEMSGQAESMSDLVNQMMAVINGGNHDTHAQVPARTMKIAAKPMSTLKKPLAKLSAKPVVKKISAPEKVIPLDENEELEKF